ncbi:MAG: TlpA family protein disulfide reductase [Bacillota bacterium]
MKKAGNIILWLAVLALLIGASYTVYSRNRSKDYSDNSIARDNKQKAMAYDFTLTDLDGNTVKLSDYRGKIVFVNFWASWCGPCRSEMPEFDRVNRELLKGEDAVILAVNLTTGFRGETEEKAREYINSSGYSLHVLLDKDGSVADKYNIVSIPTTYVVDRDGSIYTVLEGAREGKVLLDIVEELK